MSDPFLRPHAPLFGPGAAPGGQSPGAAPRPAPALPAPAPRPAPALPSPGSPGLPVDRAPTLDELERWRAQIGRHVVIAPGGLLGAYDPHVYPDAPPIPAEVREDYAKTRDQARKLLELHKRLKASPTPTPRPALPPAPPARPALPAPASPLVPAGVGRKAIPWPTNPSVGEALSAEIEALSDDLTTSSSRWPWSRTTPEQHLDAWLVQAGIRHFRAGELTRHRWGQISGLGSRPQLGSAWDVLLEVVQPDHELHRVMPRLVIPAPELWPAILPALRAVDRFRAWLGAPVVGISAYRLPWYNARIGGAADSAHMAFNALDFTFSKRTPSGDLDAGLWWRWLQATYASPGDGVGAYRDFLHYDWGRGRGLSGSRKAARWVHKARANHNDVFGGLPFSIVG